MTIYCHSNTFYDILSLTLRKEELAIIYVGKTTSHIEALRQKISPFSLMTAGDEQETLGLLSDKKVDLIIFEQNEKESKNTEVFQKIEKFSTRCSHVSLLQVPDHEQVRSAFRRGMSDVLFPQDLHSDDIKSLLVHICRKKKRACQLMEKNQTLQEQVSKDSLTGLFNRRHFMRTLELDFARAKRYFRPLSLLMIDLDDFKSINDHFGHPQGDRVLQQVGKLILQSVRFVDIPCRYGGDEFSILLPETSIRPAGKLGEALLQAIRQHPFLHEGRIHSLSVSIGISCYQPRQTNYMELLEEADKSLYQAKKKNKGCVVLSSFQHRSFLPNKMISNS